MGNLLKPITEKERAEREACKALSDRYTHFEESANSALMHLGFCCHSQRDGELGITMEDLHCLTEKVGKAKSECIADIVVAFTRHNKKKSCSCSFCRFCRKDIGLAHDLGVPWQRY